MPRSSTSYATAQPQQNMYAIKKQLSPGRPIPEFNPPQSSSVISKQTLATVTRRIKDVNETSLMSSSENILGMTSTKSAKKLGKSNHLTAHLQMLSSQLQE